MSGNAPATTIGKSFAKPQTPPDVNGSQAINITKLSAPSIKNINHASKGDVKIESGVQGALDFLEIIETNLKSASISSMLTSDALLRFFFASLFT